MRMQAESTTKLLGMSIPSRTGKEIRLLTFQSKSKLRKPATVELGKQYAGSKVSRDALNDVGSDDDPFQSGSGASGSGSESENESIEDGGMEVDGDSDDDMDDGGFDEEDDDGLDGTDEEDIESDGEGESEDDESEDEDEPRRASKETPGDDRAELRRLMASDDKLVAASITQAAKADGAKGVAVKKQRLAFDALLNARIKLQKGVTAVSTGVDSADADSNGDLIKSTEAAALTMWNTLNDLRYALANHYSTDGDTKKRKRSEPASASTPSSAIWSQMNELESQSLAHRRAVLDKWSRKIRGSKATLPNARGKLLNTSSDQQNLTAVLDSYATAENGERSAKRARATEQPNGKTAADDDTPHANGTGASINMATVYDDTPFYQSLLRELVEQRMSASNGGIDSIAMQLPSSLSINPTTGMRKDKVKRAVDTKASKGRKMRYTVHEKLQNFMAPEDRGAWSNRAREEFFASLLGKSVSKILGEGEDDDEGSDVENEDSDADIEGGLKLFRS